MNIVIAPDSFKESLPAMDVALAIERGIRRVVPDAHCVCVPLADGGEGTVDALVQAKHGRYIEKNVRGPAGKRVTAQYGLLASKKTAVIEVAAASGLSLVKGKQRNPLNTTSFGSGELIADALDRGVRKIIIGLGGSATIDGGMGVLQALGLRFYDKQGQLIRKSANGSLLGSIESIDRSRLHNRVKHTEFLLAADVTNYLCGSKGAAHVFGKQKGATAGMIAKLDKNLAHLATVIKRDMHINVTRVKGGGAAGGMGAGLYACLDARLVSGIELVLGMTNIKTHLNNADILITGEGRLDMQTAEGKTIAGVAKLATSMNVPTVAIGGEIADDAGKLFKKSITAQASVIGRSMTLDTAMLHAKEYIANAAERTMRLIVLGQSLSMNSQ